MCVLVENINPFLWVTVMNVSKSLIKSTLSALCKPPLRILNKMHGHSCSSLGIGCQPSPHRNPFHCRLLCAWKHFLMPSSELPLVLLPIGLPQLSDKPPPNKPNPASGNSIERTEDNFAGLLTGFFPSIKLICFLRPPSTSSLGSKTRELIPCPRPPGGILLNSWPCHKLRFLKMTHGLSGWSSKTKRQNGASKEQQEG